MLLFLTVTQSTSSWLWMVPL